ncbi:MAG: hypothetical protein VX599_04405 [Pseudomonadota bacterium]|nr:hypothetical protein [Pseudomonadota bacterium]
MHSTLRGQILVTLTTLIASGTRPKRSPLSIAPYTGYPLAPMGLAPHVVRTLSWRG